MSGRSRATPKLPKGKTTKRANSSEGGPSISRLTLYMGDEKCAVCAQQADEFYQMVYCGHFVCKGCYESAPRSKLCLIERCNLQPSKSEEDWQKELEAFLEDSNSTDDEDNLPDPRSRGRVSRGRGRSRGASVGASRGGRSSSTKPLRARSAGPPRQPREDLVKNFECDFCKKKVSVMTITWCGMKSCQKCKKEGSFSRYQDCASLACILCKGNRDENRTDAEKEKKKEERRKAAQSLNELISQYKEAATSAKAAAAEKIADDADDPKVDEDADTDKEDAVEDIEAKENFFCVLCESGQSEVGKLHCGCTVCRACWNKRMLNEGVSSTFGCVTKVQCRDQCPMKKGDIVATFLENLGHKLDYATEDLKYTQIDTFFVDHGNDTRSVMFEATGDHNLLGVVIQSPISGLFGQKKSKGYFFRGIFQKEVLDQASKVVKYMATKSQSFFQLTSDELLEMKYNAIEYACMVEPLQLKNLRSPNPNNELVFGCVYIIMLNEAFRPPLNGPNRHNRGFIVTLGPDNTLSDAQYRIECFHVGSALSLSNMFLYFKNGGSSEDETLRRCLAANPVDYQNFPETPLASLLKKHKDIRFPITVPLIRHFFVSSPHKTEIFGRSDFFVDNFYNGLCVNRFYCGDKIEYFFDGYCGFFPKIIAGILETSEASPEVMKKICEKCGEKKANLNKQPCGCMICSECEVAYDEVPKRCAGGEKCKRAEHVVMKVSRSLKSNSAELSVLESCVAKERGPCAKCDSNMLVLLKQGCGCEICFSCMKTNGNQGVYCGSGTRCPQYEKHRDKTYPLSKDQMVTCDGSTGSMLGIKYRLIYAAPGTQPKCEQCSSLVTFLYLQGCRCSLCSECETANGNKGKHCARRGDCPTFAQPYHDFGGDRYDEDVDCYQCADKPTCPKCETMVESLSVQDCGCAICENCQAANEKPGKYCGMGKRCPKFRDYQVRIDNVIDFELLRQSMRDNIARRLSMYSFAGPLPELQDLSTSGKEMTLREWSRLQIMNDTVRRLRRFFPDNDDTKAVGEGASLISEGASSSGQSVPDFSYYGPAQTMVQARQRLLQSFLYNKMEYPVEAPNPEFGEKYTRFCHDVLPLITENGKLRDMLSLVTNPVQGIGNILSGKDLAEILVTRLNVMRSKHEQPRINSSWASFKLVYVISENEIDFLTVSCCDPERCVENDVVMYVLRTIATQNMASLGFPMFYSNYVLHACKEEFIALTELTAISCQIQGRGYIPNPSLIELHLKRFPKTKQFFTIINQSAHFFVVEIFLHEFQEDERQIQVAIYDSARGCIGSDAHNEYANSIMKFYTDYWKHLRIARKLIFYEQTDMNCGIFCIFFVVDATFVGSLRREKLCCPSHTKAFRETLSCVLVAEHLCLVPLYGVDEFPPPPGTLLEMPPLELPFKPIKK